MASPAGGSSNTTTTGQFDTNKLFNPPTPGPIASLGAVPGQFLAPPSFLSPPPPFPPPHQAFSYLPQTSPFPHHHPYANFLQDPSHRPTMPFLAARPPQLPNPSPSPNPGARLMALLGTASTPANIESSSSMPPPSEFLPVPSAPILHQIPSAVPAAALAAQAPPPTRIPSSKMPRGRHLVGGDRVVYDVDSRLPGESEPSQLEVKPITKYNSDPGLVLGRQIAVNSSYICYGLKQGAVRVLNINTGNRDLLRGFNQRMTDTAFFAKDVHLLACASLEGRIYVWKINEGPGNDDKSHIEGKIIFALQMLGDGDSYHHPRVCWHSHKQEILFVGIGQHVLRVDAMKVGRGIECVAEAPLACPLDMLIDGVQLVGKHDAEITDLSISQWMTTRLVSASKDGTVKIWDDRKSALLTILKPHDGQPVNAVAFLTAPDRPHHIVLVTAGPLNREVKIWASTDEEGYPLSSASESWHCIQTLDLRSSSEPQLEDAFFNQFVVLPQASLILLANAKKNTIFAVHVDYGPYPAATRMDYIADFSVTIPILSLTGTFDIDSKGEQQVQVYCVQTQAVQQYALNLSQCLPPPVDNVNTGIDSVTIVSDTTTLEGFVMIEPSRGPSSGAPLGTSSLKSRTSSSEMIATTVRPSSSDASDIINFHELEISNMEYKPSAPPFSSSDADAADVVSHSISILDHSGRSSALVSSPESLEHMSSFSERDSVLKQILDRNVDGVTENFPDVSQVDDFLGRTEPKVSSSETSMVSGSHLMVYPVKNTAPLISSEILPSPPAAEMPHTRDLKKDAVLENAVRSHLDAGFEKHSQPVYLEYKEKPLTSPNMLENTETDNAETFPLNRPGPLDVSFVGEIEQSSNIDGGCIQVSIKDAYESAFDTTSQSPASCLEKDKGKQLQTSVSPPPSSHFNSADSSNEQVIHPSAHLLDSTQPHLQALQNSLNQLMIMQNEMQKQLGVAISAPITKEFKRVEASLGRSMEKVVKANVDALWSRFQEESAKQEKVARDRMQQTTNLITNYTNKDLPNLLEKVLKKEVSAIGPTLSRTITSAMEKTISSTIADAYQRGVADKSINQLEKSVSTKLEATVARHIQTQFQTSGKQALQEALRATLESAVVPAFELSCKAMFGQVDTALQKGMTEHAAAAQQQFESVHASWTTTLTDTIKSVSSMAQNMATELTDSQRQILALIVEGNAKASNQLAGNESIGLLGHALNLVEAPVDPTKELTRFISELKFEEAFTLALQRNDLALVSWLCSQVDMHAICHMTPPPLNQGILLALLQRLACDIGNDTSQKLRWMTDLTTVIDPQDRIIVPHVRSIFEQVYGILANQRTVPTISPSDSSGARLLMHVVNSMLMSCSSK